MVWAKTSLADRAVSRSCSAAVRSWWAGLRLLQRCTNSTTFTDAVAILLTATGACRASPALCSRLGRARAMHSCGCGVYVRHRRQGGEQPSTSLGGNARRNRSVFAARCTESAPLQASGGLRSSSWGQCSTRRTAAADRSLSQECYSVRIRTTNALRCITSACPV